MTRPLRFRKSFGAQFRENVASLKALHGGELPPDLQRSVELSGVKMVATVRKPRDTEGGEAQVIRDVIEMLRDHPHVIYAERRNSGAAGEHGQVKFHRIIKAPLKGYELAVADFTGLLSPRDIRISRAPVPFAIECKAIDFKGKPRDERERRQLAYIECIRVMGGKAGFATSAEQARAILA